MVNLYSVLVRNDAFSKDGDLRGLLYWSCASQDLCDTRDTGVSQAAQAVCICTVAWAACKPCIFERWPSMMNLHSDKYAC